MSGPPCIKQGDKKPSTRVDHPVSNREIKYHPREWTNVSNREIKNTIHVSGSICTGWSRKNTIGDNRFSLSIEISVNHPVSNREMKNTIHVSGPPCIKQGVKKPSTYPWTNVTNRGIKNHPREWTLISNGDKKLLNDFKRK